MNRKVHSEYIEVQGNHLLIVKACIVILLPNYAAKCTCKLRKIMSTLLTFKEKTLFLSRKLINVVEYKQYCNDLGVKCINTRKLHIIIKMMC